MPVSSSAIALIAKRMGNGVVLPDNDQWTNRFNIRSETSNRLYTVAQRKSDGSWGCDCPGWRRHRTCKHLSAIVPALEAAERAMPKKIA
jgi:hypothetical protein